MNPKLLFLAKFLGYSLLLFAFWHPISQIYIVVLEKLASPLNSSPVHFRLDRAAQFKQMATYLIPLVALVLATRGIPGMKKMAAVLAGIIFFIVVDVLLIQYMIHYAITFKQRLDCDESLVVAAVQNVKWLLPFSLWIVTCYPYFGIASSHRMNKIC